MLEAGVPRLPNISVRSKSSLEEVCTEWEHASLELMCDAAPWRTFPWRQNQRHYSGSYWSATEREHVIYESRLELTRLLFADFDPAVARIVAQPFLVRAYIDKKVRRHVPDYLLFTDEGVVVVDVKPSFQLNEPNVKFTLEWTRTLVEQRGWRYEVWSEPPATELETVRFLAGFRNAERFDAELVSALEARDDLKGRTLADAFSDYRCWKAPVVRAAVLHLMWRNYFAVSIDEPLSPRTVLG